MSERQHVQTTFRHTGMTRCDTGEALVAGEGDLDRCGLWRLVVHALVDPL